MGGAGPSRGLTVEHAFGSGPAFAVGLEEELLLVDPRTRALAPVAARVLAAMDLPERAAAHEVYAAEIELRSPPCARLGDAVAALASRRAAASEAGATLVGAGLHPDAAFGDAPLVDAERYRRVAREMRGLIRRTPEAALHVHVGMPDPETAIRAFNGLRAHLPVLAALSAGSPFWFGADSGMASARATLVRAYPGRGVPRAFRDFEDYADALAAAVAAGGLDDYTLLWWDVRPHPRLGTVEVREMDAQSRLDDVAALAALVQGLARHEAERPAAATVPHEAIAWSSFRAGRDGLEASVVQDGRVTPIREVARAAVALARPHAREAGAEDALAGIERILDEGGAAARQRVAHARGGMPALLDLLVEETATTPA